jgi:aspartyl-tRNA(Asn)/glutamyl-tRNA(Gln) amidotransferase subunit A
VHGTRRRRAPGHYASGLERAVRGWRIWFIRHFHETDMPADPEVRAALERVAQTLQALGGEIRDVSLPTLQEFAAVNRVILQSEAWLFQVAREWERTAGTHEKHSPLA